MLRDKRGRLLKGAKLALPVEGFSFASTAIRRSTISFTIIFVLGCVILFTNISKTISNSFEVFTGSVVCWAFVVTCNAALAYASLRMRRHPLNRLFKQPTILQKVGFVAIGALVTITIYLVGANVIRTIIGFLSLLFIASLVFWIHNAYLRILVSGKTKTVGVWFDYILITSMLMTLSAMAVVPTLSGLGF